MNEQAIKTAYDLFVKDGYTDSIDDFKILMQQNPQGRQAAYELFVADGYQDQIQDFDSLMGIGAEKKKLEDTESQLEDGSLVSPIVEEDYYTGTFGAILKGVDDNSIMPIGIGDFIDDMARSIAQGRAQGISAENASDLLLRGSQSSLEDIQSFIDSQKNAAKYTPSEEMQDYLKTYEENGKGFLGVVLGLAKNPSILAEVALSSMTAMANNTDSLLAAGGVIGTGAGIGASTAAAAGTVVGPAGTVIGAGAGAIAGGLASLPYAFAAAGTALEMGSTFSELLSEAAGGRELTKEVIQELNLLSLQSKVYGCAQQW